MDAHSFATPPRMRRFSLFAILVISALGIVAVAEGFRVYRIAIRGLAKPPRHTQSTPRPKWFRCTPEYC
ncbi:hypothetical protein VT03_28120 [Planctomyces sp. SH-PL14]|nr:hypothetical protein VT03_28120 [Planctomyces sp. SH-PL14]